VTRRLAYISPSRISCPRSIDERRRGEDKGNSWPQELAHVHGCCGWESDIPRGSTTSLIPPCPMLTLTKSRLQKQISIFRNREQRTKYILKQLKSYLPATISGYYPIRENSKVDYRNDVHEKRSYWGPKPHILSPMTLKIGS